MTKLIERKHHDPGPGAARCSPTAEDSPAPQSIVVVAAGRAPSWPEDNRVLGRFQVWDNIPPGAAG